ncbi:MAG TPA: sigma-70 family RNA polymerase sigma factor [Paludibacter sp.]
MDEQQIIDGCVRGEPWAQKKIYELYSSVMLGVCVRYVSDKETARDLLQDGFIKLFTKADTFAGTGSFIGWMRRIFATTALEYLRRNDALKQSVSIDEYDYFIEDVDVSILSKISADDLMTCVTELPNGYRTVFNLYAIEGYSHFEIANMLNISENTSRSQFMRARKILQKSVQTLID